MCLHKQFSQEATDIEFTEILEGRKESVSHLNDVGSDEDGDALPGHQPEGAHQVEEEQVEAKACLTVKPNLKISKRKTKLTKKFENLKFLKKVKKKLTKKFAGTRMVSPTQGSRSCGRSSLMHD